MVVIGNFLIIFLMSVAVLLGGPVLANDGFSSSSARLLAAPSPNAASKIHQVAACTDGERKICYDKNKACSDPCYVNGPGPAADQCRNRCEMDFNDCLAAIGCPGR